MKKISLKLRLMILFTILFGLIGLSCGFVSWFEAKESTDEFFDTYQMALAKNLASADWKDVNHSIQTHTNSELKHIKYADEDDEAIGFAVHDLSGKMVFHDNENGKYFAYKSKTGAFENEKVDGNLWRIIRVKSADKNYIIAIGQELEYRSDIAWDLTEEFMLPWLIGLAILLAFMLLIIEREFSPLKKTAIHIKNRKPEDLSEIVTIGLPKEVLPLVDAINELFKKIENLLQTEKRFVADAAHELRTPLTALKVQLEVLQLCIDDQESKDKAIKNLEKGLLRASHLVEQLLTLSKLENSLSLTADEEHEIDWNLMIQIVKNNYADDINQKKIIIDEKNLTSEGPIIMANQTLVETIVKNLFENAIKYSSDGAYIKISSNNENFTIYNSGVKIGEEHLNHLGKRFYRPSGNNEKGSGLGLSIVKLIAEHYNCKVNFSIVDEGFMVVVEKNHK